MSEYTNMYVALTIDHVDEEYITRTLTELKIPRLRIPTQEIETEVYSIGQGETILIASGFSLYDYKIVNSLTLYIASQYSGVRTLGALPCRLFDDKRILIYPITNRYAYNRHIVRTGNYKRSIMDNDGINVLRDSLTLRSQHSRILHSLVKNIRPGILIIATADKSIGIELEEPVIDIVENKHSKVEINIPITRTIHLANTIQIPHVHHALENDTALAILLVVPFNYSVQETYHTLLRILEQSLKAKIDRKDFERKEDVITLKILSDKEDILSTLRQHDIKVLTESEDNVSISYDRNIELHTRLIEDREIEYYFNVRILA